MCCWSKSIMSSPVLQKVQIIRAIINSALLVIGSIVSISFGNGFIAGHMACVIRSLKKKEDEIAVKDSEIEFLAFSIHLLAALGMGLAAIISGKIGRRWSFMIFSTPMTINWIVLYYSRDMNAIMASRILGGIALGALFAMKICTISEYASPKSRGLYLNLITTLTPSISIGVSHVLGNIWHYRSIALIGIIPSIVGVFLPYFWVESPHWLASKGRFQECEEAFRKLHGSNFKSETELQLLIKVERAKLLKAVETNTVSVTKQIFHTLKRRYFWDLVILSIFINAYLTAAAKLSFNTLALVIIEEITGSPDVLVFTLAVDCCIIIGSCLSCFLITKISMRYMLFVTSLIAISVLLVLSISLYFKSANVVSQWITVLLLGFYFFVLKSGPYPTLEALMGEIYPLEIKIYCFFISGAILMISLSLQIFLTSYLSNAMGYHGLFFMNAVIMLVSLGYMWWRLPETKGRTLQEIEIYFKTKTFDKVEQVLSNEQIRSLI